MIKESIAKVTERVDLSEAEMIVVMNEIMSGEANPAQIGAFITALRMKGETVEEITGAAKVMREKSTPVIASERVVVDTCGTGGDGLHTFNISTTTAFVASGAGVTVAKHGNRAVSGKCGSADLLKHLGVNIEADKKKVEDCLNELGIGFIFAPNFHGAMKYAIGPRREIGIRTIFNILGPLTNPAGAKRQLLGVYKAELTEPMAHVLRNLGSEYVFVVHGEDGMDEISVTDATMISKLYNGTVTTFEINPEDYDLNKYDLAEISGGGIEENTRITLDILEGKETGARRDLVLFNAAATLIVGGVARDFPEGLSLARESIDSGKALEKLKGLIKISQ